MKRAPLVLLFLLIASALTIGLWWSRAPGVDDVQRSAQEPAPAAASAPPTPESSDSEPADEVHRLAAHGSIELETSQLPQRIQLDVPDSGRKIEAEWIKVSSDKGEAFELPTDTTIEVTAERFPPGSYLILMRTNEHMPVPMRRYALTVR